MLALVLGGGAAKGYAHIGVLKVLEEIGIKPHIIVGASMGALVGGFVAAGLSVQELVDISVKVDKKKKKWLFKLHLSKKGLVDGKNVVKYLNTYLGNKKIEELPVKFCCIATDIEENCQIVIDKGDLVQGIRAAISIPGVFMPHRYAGHVLIDGGFINPLPISVAQELGAKKVIAVNVLRRVNYQTNILTSKTPSNKTYTIKKIVVETIDYAFSRLIDYELSNMEDGILINLNTKGIGLSHFEKAREAIDLGYKQTQKYCKALERFKR